MPMLFLLELVLEWEWDLVIDFSFNKNINFNTLIFISLKFLGLGTFRGQAAGVWPPLTKLGLQFQDMSCPDRFEDDDRLGTL